MTSSPDPLAGSDTYDILANIQGNLVEHLERFGRMEQQELVQTPQWAAHVSRLLTEAGKEIVRLRALVGAVSDGPNFSDFRSNLPKRDPHPER